MARGFDSKAVADQQEDKLRITDRPGWSGPALSPRRKSLELARVDLQRRLENAPELHRPALRSALEDLDELIRQA